MTKSILVTGATGVVGAPLIRHFERAGVQVFGCGRRRPAETAGFVEWDMASSGRPELPPVDALVHCAPIWLLPAHIPHLRQAGVTRIVAFSSSSVSGKRDSAEPTEQSVVQALLDGEQGAQTACADAGVDLTIFRPTMIYGFGRDQNISRIAALIRRFGVAPIAGRGMGLRQPVHALDLVDAVARAMDNRHTFNRTYTLAGAEAMPYRVMVEQIFTALGRTPRILPLPLPLYRLALKLVALGSGFQYTAAMADRMNRDLSFDNAPAVADFGYAPGPFLAQPARDLPAVVGDAADNE